MVDDAQPVEPAHFCAQCGSMLEANASFCQNCGAPVNHR
ncbi:zinc-ribbon domain-containing protein [Collinsella aerofaciens]